MKTKKHFLISLPILVLISGCNNTKYITLIGSDLYNNSSYDTLELVSKDKGYTLNKSLAQINRDYREDLKIIETNPTVYSGDKKFTVNELLKKSTCVIFSYNYQSVMTNYSTENYDNIDHDISLWDYYLQHTYESLSNIYKGKVIVLGLFNSNKEDLNLATYLTKFNDVLKEISESYYYTYIDTTFLIDYIENGAISDTGLHKLSYLIKGYL